MSTVYTDRVPFNKGWVMFIAHVPRFSSKIYVVSEAEFNKLPFNQATAVSEGGDDWTIDDRKREKGNLYTRGASVCSIFGIQNLLELMLAHIRPLADEEIKAKNMVDIPKAIGDEVGALRNQALKTLRGFIVGGKLPGGISGFENYRESVNYFKCIKEAIQQFNIPLSILWGQEQYSSSAFYSAEDDTWIIGTAMPVSSIQDIKRAYRFIHIDAGDQLFLGGDVGQKPDELISGGTPITPKEVNQNRIPHLVTLEKEEAV